MRHAVRLGRFAGIPVVVHWSVLAIMLLLVQGLATAVLPDSATGHNAAVYWGVAVVVAGLFMAALLAHELAHALVARHYGVRVKAITLWLLGGGSELDGDAPHARGDLLIALAGPLVSLAGAGCFAVAAVIASAWNAGPLAVAALVWSAVVNAVLGLSNLLPGAGCSAPATWPAPLSSPPLARHPTGPAGYTTRRGTSKAQPWAGRHTATTRTGWGGPWGYPRAHMRGSTPRPAPTSPVATLATGGDLRRRRRLQSMEG